MAKLHFKTVIDSYNGNPYVLISSAQAGVLHKNWRRPMPVNVQINGKPDKPWRINMMPIGDGSFYLYLHGDVRKASNTKVGDIVMVDVIFDTHYHSGPMYPAPDWFQKALSENVKASKAWNNLIPSR